MEDGWTYLAELGRELSGGRGGRRDRSATRLISPRHHLYPPLCSSPSRLTESTHPSLPSSPSYPILTSPSSPCASNSLSSTLWRSCPWSPSPCRSPRSLSWMVSRVSPSSRNDSSSSGTEVSEVEEVVDICREVERGRERERDELSRPSGPRDVGGDRPDERRAAPLCHSAFARLCS